jgi:hypothetical protein
MKASARLSLLTLAAFCKTEASLWVSEALRRGSAPGREPNNTRTRISVGDRTCLTFAAPHGRVCYGNRERASRSDLIATNLLQCMSLEVAPKRTSRRVRYSVVIRVKADIKQASLSGLDL